MEIAEIKRKIGPILEKYGITKASLFGSVASGDADAESDIDILVELPEGLSLLDFVEIKLALEDKLGRKVDLVEFDQVKSALKDSILSHQVDLLQI